MNVVGSGVEVFQIGGREGYPPKSQGSITNKKITFIWPRRGVSPESTSHPPYLTAAVIGFICFLSS